jgi:hypothetical protein
MNRHFPLAAAPRTVMHRRGAERAKGAVNGDKAPNPPANPTDKPPASSEKTPAP